ncbi:LacI family DNA-binding transcriptional regulator [Actinospica robiniae]|uniref:LacI family DNA-binding transcriptional regulator n=1 Tax=Actinospica robiniae TaxID=304901 RepID=UPI0005503555|nr:LacI family DNA-binding transcriptional regulator [Actinospica robiniae]
MVTMRDVAERAGVSTQTVSNVVSGGARVRPATEAKVRAAIAELGYVPNLVARSLSTGSTMTVGLFVPTTDGWFYSEIISEVEDILEQAGYHLLLCTTRLDGERARRQLAGLTSRSVDALLIAGDRDLIDHLPLLADARFPVALCAWETDAPDTFPVVTVDYEQAGYLAGRHLRELGHERVAVLASPAHTRRLDGFRRAFARDGLTVPDSAVQYVAEPTIDAAFAAANRALAADPELTAIFATYEVLVHGAMDAVQVSGRSIPGDVSVVGQDNVPKVSRSHPALTTVSFPRREMARQAIDVLLRAIAAGEAPGNFIQMLRPTLVVRDSSGPPPAARGTSAC